MKLLQLLLPGILLCCCLSLAAQQNYAVRFASGTVLFPENYKTIAATPAIVQPDEVVFGKYARYVQFEQVLSTDERALLTQNKVEVVQYVQFAAYLLLIPADFDFQKIAALHPRSVVPVTTTWKEHTNLRERPFGQWAQRGDRILVRLQLLPHVSIADGAELCRLEGIEVTKEGTQNGYLQVLVATEQIDNLAQKPFVKWMELEPPPSLPEDTEGRSMHRSNLLDSDHPMGKRYDGTGVNTLVRDDGEVGPHVDFKGRLLNQPTFRSGTHGDGVAGVMGAAGNIDPTKKGMAAGANIYVVDYANDFQDNTLPLHLTEGVTITNSSYSDGCNEGYTLASQTVDQQIFDNETLIHVFSAGNSNGSDCGYGAGNQWGNITGGHKMAKNAIATANISIMGGIINSSSRGPANDGRLKPDIAAYGSNQNSTKPDNGYRSFGGTSAAAPGIAGCLAQLTQAYRNIYQTQDVPTALLKLAIMATANDLGNLGPDYKFGWGHINTWRALRLLEQQRHTQGIAAQNTTTTHTVQVPAGVRQARMMIYWTDPAASESAAKALVNDLDLTVVSPSGALFLPWKLNTTPIAAQLDAPAGFGRDSLNNMEQVAFTNPTAGTYTIQVKGFEVPFGPQPYYVAWEFLTDEVKLVYPTDGTGMAPDSLVYVRWDAHGNTTNFTLRYSTDDGASWQPITTVTNAVRSYVWTVPNVTSGKVRLLLIRGNEQDTTDLPMVIAPVPQDLTITKLCPNELTLSWAESSDSLEYDVYLLGEKYMEIVGSTDTTFFTFPISSAGIPQWVSVRSKMPGSGAGGQRAYAIQSSPVLIACQQPNDAVAAQLLNPTNALAYSCAMGGNEVRLLVRNDGMNPMDNCTVHYKMGNQPTVTETLPTLVAGASTIHTFSTPLPFVSGFYQLRTWLSQPGESFASNDTLAASIQIITAAAANYFTESFEASTNLPLGWAVGNPDTKSITWTLTENPVIGLDGNSSNAILYNYYNYASRGDKDYLYPLPFDLSSLSSAALQFSYAKASFTNFFDSLRVEAFPDCDLTQVPVVLWEKGDPDLSTVNSNAEFAPDQASDWRTAVVSLEQFVGKTVLLRFVATNDYGNNLYLDNIGLVSLNPIQPDASFALVQDTICRTNSLVFEGAPQAGVTNAYSWTFGSGATPSTAVGIGPHNVQFLTAGNKDIRLIATNAFGADTSSQPLFVRPFASANFTSFNNTDTITFTNTSTNAIAYNWAFGDGATSVLANPTHVYLAAGTYSVTLTATNVCNTSTKILPVTVTTGTVDQLGLQSVQVVPNPNNGTFDLVIQHQNKDMNVTVTLLDMQGRQLAESRQVVVQQGQVVLRYEHPGLPAGVYQMQLSNEKGSVALPVVVR